MKLLVDNNISFRVAVLLNKSILPGCTQVSDFKMDENTPDRTIWNYANENGFTILTKDTDFEAMSRLYGCPPKVIQMISGNKPTKEIIDIIEKNEEAIKQFQKDDEYCLMYLQ